MKPRASKIMDISKSNMTSYFPFLLRTSIYLSAFFLLFSVIVSVLNVTFQLVDKLQLMEMLGNLSGIFFYVFVNRASKLAFQLS